MTDTTLNITGMTCGHCVNAVQRALAAVPGVTRVSVDLDRQEARIAGTVATIELVRAVETAGYAARPVDVV